MKSGRWWRWLRREATKHQGYNISLRKGLTPSNIEICYLQSKAVDSYSMNSACHIATWSKRSSEFRDATVLICGFAPSWAVHLRLLYVFSLIFRPVPEFAGWFVLVYSFVKFTSYMGCGGDLPTRSHLTCDHQEIFS